MEQDTGRLSETDIFKGLPEKHIRKVLQICRTVRYEENDTIMEEGEEGDSMYIILSGSVEVIKRLIMDGVGEEDSEKCKVFTRLDSGSYPVIGEIALLEKSRRTATIRALTDCTLYEIRKDDFMHLAESDFEFAYRIVRNLAGIVAARLRKADEDTIKLTTVLSMILKEP